MPNADSLRYTAIRDVNPNMKSLNLSFIVLEVGTQCWKKDSSDYVRTVKIADRSGSIDLAVWNRVGDFLQSGDICRLHKGYPLVRNSCLSVSLGKYGELVKVGEFCMVFSEVPDMSARNPELANFDKRPHNPTGDNRHSGGGARDSANPSGSANGTFPASIGGPAKPHLNGNSGGFGNPGGNASASRDRHSPKPNLHNNNNNHSDPFGAALNSNGNASKCWSVGEKRGHGGTDSNGPVKRLNTGGAGANYGKNDLKDSR